MKKWVCGCALIFGAALFVFFAKQERSIVQEPTEDAVDENCPREIPDSESSTYVDNLYEADVFVNQNIETPNYSTPCKTPEEVISRLNALIGKYNGVYWNTTGKACPKHYDTCYSNCYYGYQCFGFAKYIFNDLFCTGDLGTRQRETINVGNKAAIAAQNLSISEGDAGAVKSLFSKVQPGDIIQCRGRDGNGQHTIIIVSVTATGFYEFHCNWQSRCMAQYDLLPYEEFSEYYDGATIYHAANYPDADRNEL